MEWLNYFCWSYWNYQSRIDFISCWLYYICIQKQNHLNHTPQKIYVYIDWIWIIINYFVITLDTTYICTHTNKLSTRIIHQLHKQNNTSNTRKFKQQTLYISYHRYYWIVFIIKITSAKTVQKFHNSVSYSMRRNKIKLWEIVTTVGKNERTVIVLLDALEKRWKVKKNSSWYPCGRALYW